MASRKPVPQPQLRNVAALLNREPAISSHDATEQPQSVPTENIHLPKKQPRRYFDPEKLAQLTQSIQEHGILEPLLVRPLQNAQYELVAGERRLRAARELGLTEVPIISRELDDQQALQISLIENLQREDLNPVEETEAVLELLAIALETERSEVISVLHQAYNAKQRGQDLNQNVLIQLEQIETLLSQLGRFNAGTFRSSRLPLLNLPENVLDVLRKGQLEYTKAQAIARVKDEQLRSELLNLAVTDNLSLTEIKTWIKQLKPEPEATPKKVVINRLSTISKQLQKSKAWDDRKKRERITKLLDELESLTAEE